MGRRLLLTAALCATTAGLLLAPAQATPQAGLTSSSMHGPNLIDKVDWRLCASVGADVAIQ